MLEPDTGVRTWSMELEQRFGVKAPGFGYACSPIVVGDNIVLPVGAPDASVVAYFWASVAILFLRSG